VNARLFEVSTDAWGGKALVRGTPFRAFTIARPVTRREAIELVITAVLVAIAAICHYGGVGDVATFLLSAVALAALARLVGRGTEQLGSRLGSGSAGVVQSALGNLPELFISLFALNKGLVVVVQAALVGSILANSVLVLGLAFIAGGLRHGIQRFSSDRARTISTLALLAAATMAAPSMTHALHTSAAAHEQTLSLICAGVLLVVFVVTLPIFLKPAAGEEHEPPHWSVSTTTIVLGAAAVGAAFTSDWFVDALTPAIHTLHMSEVFAGLVIVAIAGNAVENVVGVQLAARNKPDFAISVIISSSLQVALALTPALIFISLVFSTHLTLVFPPMLALVLLISAILGALIVNDGESTWQEGVILVGFYSVIATSFWWGA
jgi:Ca2+:H+ antiporter